MDTWNIMLGTLPIGGLAIGVALLATSLVNKRIDDTNRRIDDTNKRIDDLRADVLARLDRIEQYFTTHPKTQRQ